MVGHGQEGYLAYVFQAKAGNGKILGCGLDLLADQPESVCLLDQFIAYLRSQQFRPKQAMDLAPLKAGWQRQAAVPRD